MVVEPRVQSVLLRRQVNFYVTILYLSINNVAPCGFDEICGAETECCTISHIASEPFSPTLLIPSQPFPAIFTFALIVLPMSAVQNLCGISF